MAGHGLSKEKLEFIANDIGPKLLPFIPREELLKHLTLDDRLKHMAVEELLKHLTVEDRLAGLTADELRKRLKELEEQEKNDAQYREE
jgi:hypothetical protein